MLVLTPQTAKALRKARRRAARGPIITDRLVAAMSAFMVRQHRADKAPSLFFWEGRLVAALRARLCLAGYNWPAADLAARDAVAAALTRARARRPSWDEGQPEWTGNTPRFFHRCALCFGPIPHGREKFCSPFCANTASTRAAQARKRACRS
jgi:hypothetical protein